MSSIDDPINAVKEQYADHSSNAVGIALEVASQLDPFARLANALRKFFSEKESKARVEALFQALEWYVREHERRLDELSKAIETPQFIETIIVAVDETLRTADIKKIQRFSKVLGHELIVGVTETTSQDAANFIRTLSELGEADIEALSILHQFQANLDLDYLARAGVPVILEPMRSALGEARKRGVSSEEFYSRISRLAGYGLALQIDKGRFAASPTEFVFLVTQSGKRLIRILTS